MIEASSQAANLFPPLAPDFLPCHRRRHLNLQEEPLRPKVTRPRRLRLLQIRQTIPPLLLKALRLRRPLCCQGRLPR
jgi:hypothetical protein